LVELVHVDHVRDRAQLVDRAQRAAALDADLDRDQEEHRDRHVDHVVDRGLDPLDELGQRGRADPDLQRAETHAQARHDQQHEQPDRHAQPDERAADPGRGLRSAVCDPLELAHDGREPRAGEAPLHPPRQLPDRALDLVGVEGAIGHAGL
jgi:hypothetical protein